MNKVVLVFDEPECCACCLCYNDFYKRCNKETRFITEENIYEQKPDWCQLKGCPQKVEECANHTEWQDGFRQGYNACIDEIWEVASDEKNYNAKN